MSIKGYTTPEAVQSYLGRTLTSDQYAQCLALLPVAEQFIDLETKSNGGWLNGPIVAEQYNLYNTGNRFYLRSAPVASLQQIVLESYAVQTVATTWVAGQDYRLADAQAGLVVLARSFGGAALYSGWNGPGFNESNIPLAASWGGYGGVALVDYTPVQAVPPLATQIATEVAAYWMTNNIHPERYGVGSVKTADQAVAFAAMMAAGCFPETIDRNILNLQQTIL